jgi:DNA-binding NtrC family response regulator
MERVLIVDDERDICESVAMILEDEDYEVDSTTRGLEGVERLIEGDYDAALLDIQMPDIDGFEALERAKKGGSETAVIIISAYGNVENAVKATRLGAFDFIEKPIDRDKLLISVRNAAERSRLRRENEEIRRAVEPERKILGVSESIKQIREIIDKVADTDASVLVTGENGVGKELVARALHRNGSRRDRPFVEVNCAAIPSELIESELFGHEKGSFTGAVKQRVGKFELADGGTIFLDEIGDMSQQAQAKVLRAIEDKVITRVGGSKKIEVDVRIVAATNKDLEAEIEAKNFREDLFHRLNVIPVSVPPLRERPEDIPVIAEAFAKELAERHKKTPPVFAESAVKLLQSLKWTGNVRELRNIVERIIILVNKEVATSEDVKFLAPSEKFSIDDLIEESESFQEFKEKAERAFIVKQLEKHGWNVSRAAESMDIQRSHLYTKMKKYEIEKGAE